MLSKTTPPPAANHLLTKELIVKECVKQGYYRTPSCNEKLYLHHKGFDGIDPNAFKEYTDVKVLWLEGNCFSQLPCGVIDCNERSEENLSAEEQAAEKALQDAVCETRNNERDVSITSSPPVIEDAQVDIFATMYPTLRQLFLHGNMFMQMPNCFRFEKLDSINLSDNFITSVSSYCPQWTKKCSEVESRPTAAGSMPSPQKSAANQPIASTTTTAAGDKAAHAARWAEQVALWAAYCTHTTESKCLCGTLSQLHLKNNHLTTVEQIAPLLCFKNLSTLDLSNNRLDDGEGVLQVLENMNNLKALYLSGNPCVRTITNYRRTVLSRCKKLLHLDDRPVFDDERRLVTAWASGGAEAEKKEKQKMREEEDEKHRRRLQEFRDMMAAARQQNSAQQNDDATEEDTDSNPTPDSSDSETGPARRSASSSNNITSEASTAVNPRRSAAAQNKTPKPNTEFYEANYGSSRNDADATAAPVLAAAPDAEKRESDGVSFGNFRVVPKKSSVRTDAQQRSGVAAAHHAVHQDPTAMAQSAQPALLDDDDGDDVYIPNAAATRVEGK